jgi:hypothetical protein
VERTAASALTEQTVALGSEQQTARFVRSATRARPRARRRIAIGLAASTAVIVAALILAGQVQNPLLRVPNVVALREDAARAAIAHSLPAATVSVRRIYNARVDPGLVIQQQPEPRARSSLVTHVRLLVSKGSPYAAVPAVAGRPFAAATASLARLGFTSRHVYAPSWTVRKGSVVGLQPRAGTRVHRPARVMLVVASGYPRAVVPDVRATDLATAAHQLAAGHLHYRLVWRLTADTPGQVLDQIPAAGTTVYQGAQIRLTVSRSLHWVKVFGASGSDSFESEPMTLPDHWRIRYRLASNLFGLAVAQVGWIAADELGGHTFLAERAGVLRTYVSDDGAGSYRLSVHPFAGTRWYVEVDTLE